jgi:hypothetical protein
MAIICGEITDNIAVDCLNKPVGGAKSKMWLININDIASVTYDTANPLIVRALTLASGKYAYQYVVYKRGHKPAFNLVVKDFGTYWNHVVNTSVQVWDNATKLQIYGLSDAYVVAIVENVQSTGDARFEIYGLGNGLTMADGAIRDLAANDGVFTMALSSEPEMEEARVPASFAVEETGAYSYTATLAAIVALEYENGSV